MNWIYKYDVNKHVLNGKPECLKQIAKKIFEELIGKPGFKGFKLTRFLRVETVDEFDEVWNDLYDYCDANAIWLGI